MAKKPRLEVTLTLERAATPERVERAARLFREMVAQAAPELPADSVTLVINNLHMKATLRSQTKKADALVSDIVAVARNPVDAVRADAGNRASIARSLASVGREFHGEGPALLPKHARKAIKLDAVKTKSMQLAAKAFAEHPTPSNPGLRGTSEIRSAVLRAGRAAAGGPLQARIVLEGQNREVDVAPEALEAVLVAVRTGMVHRIKIRALWHADARGVRKADLDSICILGASPVTGLSGAEFLKHAPKLSPDSFDEIMSLLNETRNQQD